MMDMVINFQQIDEKRYTLDSRQACVLAKSSRKWYFLENL